MTYSDFLTGQKPKLTENQIGVIEYLDKEFVKHDGVVRFISYRVPFYKLNKRICYINPKKTGHIELCFMNGRPLSKEFSIIQLHDRKWVGGIMVDCDVDINIKQIQEVFSWAIHLDKAGINPF